jgi:hypothetical protein
MSDLEELAEIVRNRPPDRSAPRRARPGARFGAVLVDLISITVVSFLLAPLLWLISLIVPDLRGDVAGPAIGWAAIMFYSALDIFPGDSVGKWLISLTIALPDGRPVNRGRLVRRWLIKYAWLLLMGGVVMLQWLRVVLPAQAELVNGATEWVMLSAWCASLLILIGMIGALLPHRRALHDWLSGTAVFDQIDLIRKPPQGGHAFQVQQPRAPDASEQR